MKVLIFGATGFLGANLVRYLLQQNIQVRVFCRDKQRASGILGSEVELFHGDMLLADNIRDAMKDVEGIYNLAACTSSLRQDDEERKKINVEATTLVGKVALERGMRLLHVSSVSAIGVPPEGEIADEMFVFNNEKDHYSLTKFQGERRLKELAEQGLDVVFVCPGNVIGHYRMKEMQKKAIQGIASGSMRVYPSGGVCLADVDDVVRGIFSTWKIGRRGERYILGGENVTYKEYFREIALATGGRPPWLKLPGQLMLLMGHVIENLYGICGKTPFIDVNSCRMISRNLFYSSNKAQRELDYIITDFSDTIKKVVLAESEDENRKN